MYPLLSRPASPAVRLNMARNTDTEMILPGIGDVVSKSGVFGVGLMPGSAFVYSSQAWRGQRGEPLSAGIGTGVVPFCACKEFVHMSAIIIPCFEGVTSAHDVCLVASNWSIVGGARFEILR